MDWLGSSTDRESVVELAAAQLLAAYKKSWPEMVPVELHRLASTLNTTICRVSSLEGGARLFPAVGGFRIVVDESLPVSKQRMGIAHELVHTLFYDRGKSTPTRIKEPTEGEEHFCYDVGRRLLAPTWMIDMLCVKEIENPRRVFELLVSKMKLSRPVAAQVMLRDRQLCKGIAGSWVRDKNGWVIQRGRFATSPTFSKSDLQGLKGLCRAWLSDPSVFTGACEFWQYPNGKVDSMFVVGTITPGRRSSVPGGLGH